MPEFAPQEKEEIKQSLILGLKKGNLIAVVFGLIVAIIIISVTTLDIGKLFKGFTRIDDITTQTTDKSSNRADGADSTDKNSNRADGADSTDKSSNRADGADSTDGKTPTEKTIINPSSAKLSAPKNAKVFVTQGESESKFVSFTWEPPQLVNGQEVTAYELKADGTFLIDSKTADIGTKDEKYADKLEKYQCFVNSKYNTIGCSFKESFWDSNLVRAENVISTAKISAIDANGQKGEESSFTIVGLLAPKNATATIAEGTTGRTMIIEWEAPDLMEGQIVKGYKIVVEEGDNTEVTIIIDPKNPNTEATKKAGINVEVSGNKIKVILPEGNEKLEFLVKIIKIYAIDANDIVGEGTGLALTETKTPPPSETKTPPPSETPIPPLPTPPATDPDPTSTSNTSSNSSSSTSSSSSNTSSSSSSSKTDSSSTKSSPKVKITDAEVFPKGFNPLLAETKIIYEITQDAIVELRIMDESGITIVTLLDDEEIDKGEYSIWWDGTDKAEGKGKIVKAGRYTYKIIAKNKDTKEIDDTESGTINVVYAETTGDFEDAGTYTTTSIDTTSSYSTDIEATMSLQNATSGVTAETGPSTLIYLLLPFGGYFFRKK